MLRRGPQGSPPTTVLASAPPSRDDRLPEEINAAHRDAGARRLQQTASPSPLVHRPDSDADQVQKAGRNDKADAIEQPTFAGRQFGAVRVAVEQRERPDKRRGGKERRTPLIQHGCAEQQGGHGDANFDARERHADQFPMKPPNAITIGNVTGRSQMAGAPSCAPQRPTETIARI